MSTPAAPQDGSADPRPLSTETGREASPDDGRLGPRRRARREAQEHSADRRAPERGRRVSRRTALLIAGLTALVLYGLDQGTKALVERTMELGESIPLLDGVLQWHYILNSGAAFSLGEDYTWVFTLIMAVVSISIIAYLPRVRSAAWALGLGLVLGGALGNLTDRVLRWPGFPSGHVVDFIHLNHFAVFNVADCGVVVGVILIAALLLFGKDAEGESPEETA